MAEHLNPLNLPYPEVGMNQGVATKDFVFAGGMALDWGTMQRHVDADTIASETRMCLEEIQGLLAEAGSTISDIVKTTIYLTDDSYRQECWEEYTKFFGQGPYPARTTFVVGIAAGCRVEIDSIAVRSAGN